MPRITRITRATAPWHRTHWQGISVYGWVTLPPDGRVPLHFGIGGYRNWQPKTIALILYPVIGAVVFAVVLTATGSANSSGKTAPAVIAPLLILVTAVTQYFAVRAAINNGGPGN